SAMNETTVETCREKANAEALARIVNAEPVLVGVAAAGDAVSGATPTTILTSGAPLEWPEYSGGQRRAMLHGAVYEGMAGSVVDAEAKPDRGEIQGSANQQPDCISSVAGIYTASMPVFIVRDDAHGNVAFCNFYEGKSRIR